MNGQDDDAGAENFQAIEDDLAPFCEALRGELESRLQVDALADQDLEAESAWPLDELDADLQVFTRALQVQIESQIEAQIESQTPARAANDPSPVQRFALSRTKIYAMAGVASAAAACLLVFAIPEFRAATLSAQDQGDLAAQQLARGDSESGRLTSRRELPERANALESASETPEEFNLVPATADDSTPSVEENSLPLDKDVSEKRAAPSRAKTSQEADALARAAWEAGDEATAIRWLRYIIRHEPRSSAAESAYADLFALGRHQGGRKMQLQLWREYLRAFPQGRYAQDARAGVCNNSSGSGALACWRDYLKYHPNGTHRESAQAWLKNPPASE